MTLPTTTEGEIYHLPGSSNLKTFLITHNIDHLYPIFEKKQIDLQELQEFDEKNLKSLCKDILKIDSKSTKILLSALKKSNTTKIDIGNSDDYLSSLAKRFDHVIKLKSEIHSSLTQLNNLNLIKSIEKHIESTINGFIKNLKQKQNQLLNEIDSLHNSKKNGIKTQIETMKAYHKELNQVRIICDKQYDDKMLQLTNRKKYISENCAAVVGKYDTIKAEYNPKICFNVDEKSLNEFLSEFKIDDGDGCVAPDVIEIQRGEHELLFKYGLKVDLNDIIDWEMQYRKISCDELEQILIQNNLTKNKKNIMNDFKALNNKENIVLASSFWFHENVITKVFDHLQWKKMENKKLKKAIQKKKQVEKMIQQLKQDPMFQKLLQFFAFGNKDEEKNGFESNGPSLNDIESDTIFGFRMRIKCKSYNNNWSKYSKPKFMKTTAFRLSIDERFLNGFGSNFGNSVKLETKKNENLEVSGSNGNYVALNLELTSKFLKEKRFKTFRIEFVVKEYGNGIKFGFRYLNIQSVSNLSPQLGQYDPEILRKIFPPLLFIGGAITESQAVEIKKHDKYCYISMPTQNILFGQSPPTVQKKLNAKPKNGDIITMEFDFRKCKCYLIMNHNEKKKIKVFGFDKKKHLIPFVEFSSGFLPFQLLNQTMNQITAKVVLNVYTNQIFVGDEKDDDQEVDDSDSEDNVQQVQQKMQNSMGQGLGFLPPPPQGYLAPSQGLFPQVQQSFPNQQQYYPMQQMLTRLPKK